MLTTSTIAGAAKIVAAFANPFISHWLASSSKKRERQSIWTSLSNTLLSQINSSIESFERITPLAFPSLSVPLADIYVPQNIVSAGNEQKVKFRVLLDEFPSPAFTAKGKFLLTDSAGLGKSTVSRVLFLSALKNCYRLPILLDLRRVNGDAIELDLSKQFGVATSESDVFVEFLRTQAILFIFDGFDEVSEQFQGAVSRSIRDFINRATKAQFLITSRPEFSFSEFADFERVNIGEFSESDAYSLIRKYGKAFRVDDASNELVKRLQENKEEAVKSFLRNPLLTSLLLRSFEHRSVIPVKRSEFYRQVYDALYDSHDLNKETGYTRAKRSGLQKDEFHRVLRAVAAEFHGSGDHEVTESSFCEMVRNVRATYCVDLKFKEDDFLHDATKSVPLVVRDGLMLRWPHRSLMDYFFAEYFLRDFQRDRGNALWQASTGLRRRSFENFLTVVAECNPVLFAEGVTIRAADELLAHRDRMLRSAEMHSKLSNELISALACFELVTYVAPNFEDIRDHERYLAGFGTNFDSSSFVGLFGFGMSGEKMVGVVIYSNILSDALNVPRTLGVVPTIPKERLHRFRAKHNRIVEELQKFPSGTPLNRLILEGRCSKAASDTPLFVCEIGHGLKIINLNSLTQKVIELKEIVHRSNSARAKELFF